ncbi:MAG TPA: hypothetical protein IAA29_17060 [Candidatus Paenibacillus intestinavium]|nr:hypothetical protein [Candidatus Paenibacillus intestinavium]
MKRAWNMKFSMLIIALSLLSLCWLAPSIGAAANDIISNGATTQLEGRQSNSSEDQQQSSHQHQQKHMSKEQLQAHKLDKLKRLANYFEIDIEGKSAKELRVEIEKAKNEQPEKWEMFKQKFRAKKLEEIREFAKSQGISIEGKTEQQLREELHKLKHNMKE